MIATDPPENDAALPIKVLEPADVDRLRLGWWSRTDESELRRLLARAPGLSVWVPTAQEYVLVGPWRHRDDVVHAQELMSVRHPVELTRAAIERARESGARLFLAVEIADRRPGTFYDRAGLDLLETVQSYELVALRHTGQNQTDVDIRRVDELSNSVRTELIKIDWGAFPWLWRNSDEEFGEYIAQPGVEIYLLREGGTPIGYLGITVFPGWGHIDRLAVLHSEQRRGYGRMLTEFAINRLMALGAVRVGLSTQQRNKQSQLLYKRLGFQRQVSGDYRIYGRALWQNDSIEDLVMGHQE